MNYEELLKYLDIEEPSEFQYFENIADILECEEDIEEEALERLFAGVEKDELAELTESFFNELTDNVPQKSVDIYTLVDTIGRSLTGLAKSLENDDSEGGNVSLFSEEINRFRKWYMLDTEVSCRNIKTGEEHIATVAEAIALYVLESLDGDEYEYDFESCLDYPIEEYVMSFSSLAAAEYDEDDLLDEDHIHVHDHDHDHDHHGHTHKHYDESILDDGYVYDDEFDDSL